ncbi:hypothetical protein C7974DRAFT_450688 [Boeremia exigua]|uniref:uncharacterized protein n=1 Tax=Boeremia exigua TaxID=749465 RepID=UPI001E8D1B8B|nr:uncharacterized protein C7974DRAFT_450688 [Boeremia exigua]KAH6637693.1 hypothetical protein C7974DRAFT_450688 [Boeremia exigua]
MDASWTPAWHRENLVPAFMGKGLPLIKFGRKKYLWGNMPVGDILIVNDNEGGDDRQRDVTLFFAVSGDLRNVIETIASIPAAHKGKCDVVVNDTDFAIVARNAIMLLVALPRCRSRKSRHHSRLVFSLAALCDGTISSDRHFASDRRRLQQDYEQAARLNTGEDFSIRGRSVRLVLKKEQWSRLVTYFQAPEGLTAEEAQALRRDITLAPSRVDFRERAMVQWSPALRQGEQHYRELGVLLPYGCPISVLDTSNPTFFQTRDWPMTDSASPRDEWSHADHSKHTLTAKAATFGAIFSMLRDLLFKFGERVQDTSISFELSCTSALNITGHNGTRRFDRIEISNICDRGYVGPYASFESLLMPSER